MTLDALSSGSCVLGASITGVCHHVLLVWLRDGTQGLVHARFLDFLSNTWGVWDERCG